MNPFAEAAEALRGTSAATPADAKRALWACAVSQARDEFSRPRIYKVRLAVFVCSEIEVRAESPLDAQRIAEQRVDEAAVTLHTAPASTRVMVQRRSDPRNPESALEWVEVVYGPIDLLDPNCSPQVWHIRKK